jgi:hypothetical protein
VPLSLLAFALGVAYGLGNVVVSGRIPNGAVLLILFAVMLFLVGLVSEQISSLRFDAATRHPPDL